MRKIRILGLAVAGALALGACRPASSIQYARERPGLVEHEERRMRDTLCEPRRRAPRPPVQAAWTVDECIADALDRNRGIRAAKLRWHAASSRVDVVTEYPDPVAKITYMPEPIETRLGPTDARVGVMQKIPWPGKLDARGRVQAAQAEIVRLELRTLAWRLATDVRLAYADLVDVDRDSALLEAQIALLQGWRDIVQARLELNQARSSDTMQIDIRVQRLREDLAANVERRRAVLGRLNALRSRPADTPLVTIDPSDPPPPDSLADLVFVAKTRNPELERLEQVRRAAEEGVRLANLNRYTDPTVGLEYVFVGEGPLHQFSDNGNDAVGITLSIPLPIHQRGRSAERTAACLTAAAASEQYDAYVDRLRGELATSLHGYREARSRETTYREQVLPLVEREIEVGLEEYATGRGSMTDLLKYEGERLRVLQDVRRARTRGWKERARIDYGAGARLGTKAGPVTVSAPPPPSPEIPEGKESR